MKNSEKRPFLPTSAGSRRRLSAVLLAALIFLTSAISAAVPAYGDGDLPFRDVKTGSWYYGAVKYVYEKGIMNASK